jgi:DNA polymerase I-like protein with 3'-5' exonuclease and polymerase domains/uracil-DNA glycosylase
VSSAYFNPASYDPEAHGAQCSRCPLRGNVVVPGESNAGARVCVIGEAPGEQEENAQRPFVGASGNELVKALRRAGLRRGDVHITNVLLCRPPSNDLKKLLQRISRENKARDKEWRDQKKANEKEGLPAPPPPSLVPTPMECCTPRLEREMADYTDFITLGKTATSAVAGTTTGIQKLRGGLMELGATDRTPLRRVMPTVHPAFVLRAPRWRHVFFNDVVKGVRWFNGDAKWIPPKATYNPSAEELDAFLFGQGKGPYVFDIETDGIESLTAKIRCIAIGTSDEVVCVSLLGKDGFRRFYPEHEEQRIIKVLKDFFEDPTRVKAGHNAGYYDRIVLESNWGIQPSEIIDTILLHRNVESELPHGLAYVASLFTEAPAWKTDREGNKLSTDAESDEELAEYCVNDTAITARCLVPLVDQVRLRDQVGVWQMDQKVQSVCVDMHTIGMYVDQERRLAKEKALLSRRHELLTAVYQVRDLLFDTWKLDPPLDDNEKYTASDDPSTADIVLRSLLMSREVPEDQREIIKLLRYYRKVMKVLGTYVVKLRPWDMGADLGWDEDDDWVDKETRKKYGEVKRGIVDPRTGRMHPGWNAHVAATGRLSSSKPINAQNFPYAMRTMVTAAPGNVLVGADADQLEIRVAAAHWGVEKYLRAFEQGKDPHSMTAFMVFGDRFCQAAGIDPRYFEEAGKLVGKAYDDKGTFIGKGEAKNLRSLSKAVHFASQYMAGVERVHKMIQSTETDNGDGTTDLPYAKLPLRRIRQMRENWLSGATEYEAGWNREITAYRQSGYLAEPVTGRRRDFLDGENPNELANFPIQGGAAGLMNISILQLHEAIPRNKWGPGTGIIGQVHDWIGVECPADKAEEVKGLLEECMNQTHPNLPGVKFTATADVGHSWDEV